MNPGDAVANVFVSTHSRPKAAGRIFVKQTVGAQVSTHSRPKAAGYGILSVNGQPVSTHSRPKAAGLHRAFAEYAEKFQHTAARRRLDKQLKELVGKIQFQHTAARRRLERC